MGTKTAQHVLLYVPNLIGYSRIITMMISVYLLPSQPWNAMMYYMTSALLDAFDGWAARSLNQSSSMGAMLDMLTDRIGTCILAMYVATLAEYKDYIWFFQLFVALDIVAHWAHLHSTMMSGRTTHKTKAGGENKELIPGEINLEDTILGIYYQKLPLFFMCAANELFFIVAYLIVHEPKESTTYTYLDLMLKICFPLMLIKMLISLVHLCTAFWNVACMDAAEANRAK